MFKILELSSLSITNTQFWPSDTPPASRTCGKIYSGPSKFKTNMPQKAVKSKSNTTTCGIPSETKPLPIWRLAITPKDLSLPVFHLEVDLQWSVMLTSFNWICSRTSRSSPTEHQELLMPTGPNGWKLKSNQIQSTFASRAIQSVSSQNASPRSATTNTQELDTLATKRKKNACQPVK